MPDLDVALRVRAQTQQAGRQVGDLRRRVRGLGTTTGRAAIQTRQFGAAWTNGTTALAGAQRRLVGIKTLIATLGIGLAIRAVVNSFADFEKGLIGVGKTANLNAAELALLGGNITALGSRLPVARAELLEIAEAAGQLGVKGVADLTLFAETVGKLGLASDLSGEEAATTLARILTVTKEGVGEVDRFASVIVDLGNNFAASEAEIAAMATRVAQATALFGVMSHEAAGMGAAMRAVGVEAEAGGTVVGRAFQAISDAVRNGGEELETIAKITGTTGAEVSRTFGDNATEAFRQFVVGLGRIKDEGGDVARTLTDLDLEGVRVIQVLGSMANNAEVLTDALRRANVEVEANQALNREAAVAAESFAAQMQLVKNDVNSASAVIGQELAPVILKLTDDFREWIKEAKRTGEIREFAEGLGDVFRVLAANMDLVVAAAGALVGLRLGSAFGPWGAAIGLVVGGLGSLIALSAAATEEIDIHKSAVERLAGALDDLAGPASRASEATRTEARANLDAAIAKERNYQATLKLREEQLRSTFPKLPENTVGRSDAEILAKLGLSPNRGPSGFLPIVVQNALDTARALRLVQTALAASKDAVANAQADAALIETGTNFRQRAPEVVAAPIVVAPPEAAPPDFRPIDLGRDGGRSLGELRTELERARRTFDAITSAAERARAQLGGTFSGAIQGALEFRDASIAALRDIGEADSDLAAEIEAITRERISGAWQEEADRRADAHREAAAEIEAIELDLGLRSVYDAAIADAMRWRDETRAALGEIGDDMGDLGDRSEAAYARMIEAAEEARERQEIEAAGFIGGVRAALQDMAEETRTWRRKPNRHSTWRARPQTRHSMPWRMPWSIS